MSESYQEYHEEMGLVYVPKTIAQILVHVSRIKDIPTKIMILGFHIQEFEEELSRCGTYMDPLHFSIHLLNDAIHIMKREILLLKEKGKYIVTEELMPLKSGFAECSGVKESIDIDEKKKWMSSAQLWTSPGQYDTSNQDSVSHQNSEKYAGFEASGSECNLIHKALVFMPLENTTVKDKGIVDPISSVVADAAVKPVDLRVKRKAAEPRKHVTPPPKKKLRRCWSPELHELFVGSLRLLGGVQCATPKQIREMMNIEGLTNNEVKSHLQKYRVYIRKLSSTGQLSNPCLIRDNQMPVVEHTEDESRAAKLKSLE